MTGLRGDDRWLLSAHGHRAHRPWWIQRDGTIVVVASCNPSLRLSAVRTDEVDRELDRTNESAYSRCLNCDSQHGPS